VSYKERQREIVICKEAKTVIFKEERQRERERERI
jgi:hypothetical protein